ncbi:MAG TPA: RibD family protein [Armatimonadota bacterium]|nr:RibD family protein [Armatimonadota bacterium]
MKGLNMFTKVILHNMTSVDGRLDWFPVNMELFYGLIPMWQEDATLAGADTLLAVPLEEADETQNEPSEPDQTSSDNTKPLLVVPDSKGKLRGHWHLWLKQPYWRGGVALCSKSTPSEYYEYLKQHNIDWITAGEDKVDLKAALEELGSRYGVKVVRADSGGRLNGALLRAGLVSEVSVLFSPYLVGGITPKSIFAAPDLESEEGIIQLKLLAVETLDDSVVWVRYEVVK